MKKPSCERILLTLRYDRELYDSGTVDRFSDFWHEAFRFFQNFPLFDQIFDTIPRSFSVVLNFSGSLRVPGFRILFIIWFNYCSYFYWSYLYVFNKQYVIAIDKLFFY